MLEEELRDPERIVKEMRDVRIGTIHLDDWTLEEVSQDILSIVNNVRADIIKLDKMSFNNKKATQRLRVYFKTLETLGDTFRKKSLYHEQGS